MKSVIFVVMILVGQLSWGYISISGAIQKSKSTETLLITKNGSKYKLNARSLYISQIIDSLKTGDEIVASGTRTKTTVNIVDIDFVNLNDMIGTWLSDDSKIYNFESNKKFTIDTIDELGMVTNSYVFYYTVSPSDQKDKWNFLFSNANHVNFADLMIINDKMYLNFINPDTGRVTHTQQLHKIK